MGREGPDGLQGLEGLGGRPEAGLRVLGVCRPASLVKRHSAPQRPL